MPQQLQNMWQELNTRYFEGSLPPIDITWSRRLTSSTGMFVSSVGPRHPHKEPNHRLIRVSRPLLSGESEWEIYTTLAHEMIHQWQFDILKRHANHGKDFHRKMQEMNGDGLGITIHHSMKDAVQALCRYTWCCKKCGRLYHRQRRTIRPRRHLCGECGGTLREVRGQQSSTKSIAHQPTQATASISRQMWTHACIQLAFRFEDNRTP